MAGAHDKVSIAGRRGRRAGILLFALIVTSFTGICSVEIILQAWAPPGPPAQIECRPGVAALIRAVHRARDAAMRASGGEREAVESFRKALSPEWSQRPGLSVRCSGDPEAHRALSEIDRLRYAEEHALRYEALDVASRRLRVDAIERRLGESP